MTKRSNTVEFSGLFPFSKSHSSPHIRTASEQEQKKLPPYPNQPLCLSWAWEMLGCVR